MRSVTFSSCCESIDTSNSPPPCKHRAVRHAHRLTKSCAFLMPAPGGGGHLNWLMSKAYSHPSGSSWGCFSTSHWPSHSQPCSQDQSRYIIYMCHSHLPTVSQRVPQLRAGDAGQALIEHKQCLQTICNSVTHHRPPATGEGVRPTGSKGTLGKELVPFDPFLNLLNCRGSKALRWLADQPRRGR